MKKGLIICFVALMSTNFIEAQDSINNTSHNLMWEKSFTKAKYLSKSENKTMLIFFTGSDWCGPCKMLLEDFFNTANFSVFKKNIVLYEADFPRNRDLVSDEQKKENNRLKQKYKVSSYPTIIMVNSKGKELGRRKGYNLMRDPSYHFEFIKKYLK